MISYKKREKYKYNLHKDFSYQCTGIEAEGEITVEKEDEREKETKPLVTLEISGKLTIRKGYAWDGATCTPDSATIMTGSLVHDVLYQLMREEKIDFDQRLRADQLLREICLEAGMSPAYAWWVFWGVRLFGACYA
ncbi:MAG: DUF1353 domain-containing protein, partial [Sedimenticola sp.]